MWTWEKKFAKEGVGALFRGERTFRKDGEEIQGYQAIKEAGPLAELEIVQRENRLLQIENEYLKKMKALIQEPKDTDKSKRK